MTIKQLFIPEIGTELILAEDWTFCLYAERRNAPLGIKLGLAKKEKIGCLTSYKWIDKNTQVFYRQPHLLQNADNKSFTVTLPTGTILKIDRIYIRKGNDEYSSISFYCTMGKSKPRFWAKLEDVNKIKFQ